MGAGAENCQRRAKRLDIVLGPGQTRWICGFQVTGVSKSHTDASPDQCADRECSMRTNSKAQDLELNRSGEICLLVVRRREARFVLVFQLQ